jgi:hypothetical protein
LSIPPEGKLGEDLIDHYSLKSIDPRLEGILLSRHGVYIKDGGVDTFSSVELPIDNDNDQFKEGRTSSLPFLFGKHSSDCGNHYNIKTLYLGCCSDCRSKMNASQTEAEKKKKMFFPPVNSIANGNWIGYLPTEYQKFTRSDEQCLALMQASIYLSTIVGNEPSKSICSHGYIIQNPDTIISCIPKDITGVVRMTLVGAFTPFAEAAARKRFVLNHERNKRFLNEFLLVKNTKYIEHEQFVNRNGFDALDKNNMQIVDRLEGGANPVNPKLIQLMEFDHTSHHNDNGRFNVRLMQPTVNQCDNHHMVIIDNENGQSEEGDQGHDANEKVGIKVGTTSDKEVDAGDDEMVTTTRTRILFNPVDIYSPRKLRKVFF